MNNDFTPSRNIINEWYAKDNSKKIRAVFRDKGMSGQRLATNPLYSYIKGEDGTLRIRRDSAPVVELIFGFAPRATAPAKLKGCCMNMAYRLPEC